MICPIALTSSKIPCRHRVRNWTGETVLLWQVGHRFERIVEICGKEKAPGAGSAPGAPDRNDAWVLGYFRLSSPSSRLALMAYMTGRRCRILLLPTLIR